MTLGIGEVTRSHFVTMKTSPHLINFKNHFDQVIRDSSVSETLCIVMPPLLVSETVLIRSVFFLSARLLTVSLLIFQSYIACQ